MLKISGLKVRTENEMILNGLDLEIKEGEVHAIMGPNGSGKSTLAKVIAGHPAYEVVDGEILYDVNFKKVNLLKLSADERAKEGIFLGFQYPVDIPGITNMAFLHSAFNSICKHQGSKEMSAEEFSKFVRQKAKYVEVDESFLDRPVNAGLSGGEKKRNELLQMAVLSPRLAFLDEVDSGLDIDALKDVAKGVNKLSSSNNALVLITHYQRLLNYITPQFVHILYKGKIVESGDKSLAEKLESQGYEWVKSNG